MRRGIALAAAMVLTVIGLAACGGGSAGLIPTTNVAALNADLNKVSGALAAQDCSQANAALEQLGGDIGSLPTSVNLQLINELNSGYDSLLRSVPKQCHSSVGPTGSTGVTGTTGTTKGTGASGSTASTGSSGASGSSSPTGQSGTSIGPGGGVGPPPTGGTSSTGSTNVAGGNGA